MITVHHLDNSRSQRVLWLLEELALQYDIKAYARDRATLLAPAELRAVHPLGKSPVISDDGIVVAESGAIIEYLIERHGAGRLRPAAGSSEQLRYTYWLHYAEGSAMPPLLLDLVFTRVAQAPMPFFVRPIVKALSNKVKAGYIGPQIKLHMDFIEGELAHGPWFAGDAFSAADIQMSYVLEAAQTRAEASQGRPRIADWLARIHARPAYQRALAKGGRFEVLG